MELPLDPKARKLITERVKSGKYASPQEVVTAALHALERDDAPVNSTPENGILCSPKVRPVAKHLTASQC